MAVNWLQLAARCKFWLLRPKVVANGCNQKQLQMATKLLQMAAIRVKLENQQPFFESGCNWLLERNQHPFSAMVAKGCKWLLIAAINGCQLASQQPFAAKNFCLQMAASGYKWPLSFFYVAASGCKWLQMVANYFSALFNHFTLLCYESI